MSLALIPIAALLLAIITSSPSDKPVEKYQSPLRIKQEALIESSEKKEESKKIMLALQEKSPEQMIQQANADPLAPHEIAEAPETDEDSEYQTILSFISTKYKKVSDNDAHEIAKSLVVYGKEHDMDPKLAAAVIARESAFNKEAVSSTGAKGLGQIKDFNFSTLNITNPFDIQQNIGGTTQYLKKLMTKWDSRMDKPEPQNNESLIPQSETDKIKLTLASYYKGFTNVNKKGVDSKTEEYVRDIMKNYNDLQSIKNEKRFKKL